DRDEFLVIQPDARTFVLHEKKQYPINRPDFVHLLDAGYVRVLHHGSSDSQTCCVTNDGIEYLSRAVAVAPIPFLVERSVSVVQKELPEEFRRCQELLDQAAAKLPQAKTEHDFSEIAHKCREALQEFAALAYEKWVPVEKREELSKEKNLKKLKAVVQEW